MRRAAGAHVVLGVNLEEAARLRPREDRLQVLGLEACPRQSRNRMRRKAGRRGFPLRICGQDSHHGCPRFPALACMWRVGLHSRRRSVLAVRQRDRGAGSALDELPRVALEIDGRGTLAGRAGSGGAVVLSLQGDAEALLLVGGYRSGLFRSVRGAAEASVASALDRALARTSEVMAVFADISLLRVAGWPSLGALGLRVPARQRYVGCQRKNDGLADSLAAETHRTRACWKSWMRRQLVQSPNRSTTGMLHPAFEAFVWPLAACEQSRNVCASRINVVAP